VKINQRSEEIIVINNIDYMQGKVKWYDEIKGFGFIHGEDKKDIFVHRTGLVKAIAKLTEGQSVEFEIKQGDKGLVAVNVKVIENS